MLKHICQSSLVRQLMGAGAGMLIALAMYHSYKFSAGYVQAMLTEEVEATEEIEGKEGIEGVVINEPIAPIEIAKISVPEPVAMELIMKKEVVKEKVVETKVAAVIEEEMTAANTAVLHNGAPNLPQSGIGLWVAMIIAFTISVVAVRRSRTQLAASRV